MIAAAALVVSACQPPVLASPPASPPSSAPSYAAEAPVSVSAPQPVTPKPTASTQTPTGGATATTTTPPTSVSSSSAVASTPSAQAPDGPIFGINDSSGYNTDPDDVKVATAEVSRLGLKAVRMGMDYVGCERVGKPCAFTKRDAAVKARRDAGITIHSTIAFRTELEQGSGEDQWVKNYGWKCGQIADHYQDDVRYYIVDNEPDLSYGDGQRAKVPPKLVVRMQQACYEAIKAVDSGILVESSPAMSAATPYNRDLLAAGIDQYADVIGTHIYGGQISPAEDSVKVLQKYMTEFGVDLPISCSECGVTPSWYKGGSETWKGLTGNQARAQWLRDFAAYAKDKDLYSALYFSMYGPEGGWQMHEDPLALDALHDIGHNS